MQQPNARDVCYVCLAVQPASVPKLACVTCRVTCCVGWLSGNALVSINELTLRLVGGGG